MKNLISSLLLVLIFSNQSLAEETKSKTSNRQKEVTDPDLSLSIEELKKKYPISLLDEKKKNYKPGQKINIDDYSIEEIKAAFLNADGNFVRYEPTRRLVDTKDGGGFVVYKNVVVKNPHEIAIIEAVCDKLGIGGSSNLNKSQERLRLFVFSGDLISRHISNYISAEAGHCIENKNPFYVD